MIELLQLDLTFQLLELMLMPRLHIRQLVQVQVIYNSIWNLVMLFQKNFASHQQVKLVSELMILKDYYIYLLLIQLLL